MLQGDPAISRLIIRPQHRGMVRATMLRRTLAAGNYDTVILFQSTLSNALLTFLQAVPVRVGFAQDGCEPFLTHRVSERGRGEHIVDAYLRLAESLTGKEVAAHAAAHGLRITVSADDAAFADAFLYKVRRENAPVVGLVIGATRPQKRWSEEYFARLAHLLSSRLNAAILLLGGPDETESAARIAALCPVSLHSAIGRTTEKQLAAVSARLSAIVSGDSGPLHIATAVRTPVVALFGSTDPAETGVWQPAHGKIVPATTLYDRLGCAPCRKSPTCGGTFDCLWTLTPERVFDAVYDLLGGAIAPTFRPIGRTNESFGRKTDAVVRPDEQNGIPNVPVFRPIEQKSIPNAPVFRPNEQKSIPNTSVFRPDDSVMRTTELVFRPKSVLVITKHHFMGDAIVTVPLLRAVRRVFGNDTRITVLTGAAAATVLEHCPYTDRVIAYNPKQERGYLRQMRFLKDAEPDAPQMCLVVDRSFRSAVLAATTGASVRAGFAVEYRSPLLTHRVPYRMDRREIECCLDVLRVLVPDEPGVNRYDPTPELWITNAERTHGKTLLNNAGAGDYGTLIGVQPGATFAVKQWETARFAKVADDLAHREHACFVLLGGKNETETAHRFRELVSPQTPVLDLTSATTLRETMAVLSHMSLFISNDTGVAHIAAGMNTPLVTIFGATIAHKWGNYGAFNAVIRAEGNDLANLAPDTVTLAATRILDKVRRVGGDGELRSAAGSRWLGNPVGLAEGVGRFFQSEGLPSETLPAAERSSPHD